MKLLFACDSEMLFILRYLYLISPELHLSKYPLISNIIQVFLPCKIFARCKIFSNTIYATHLSSLASKEKLHSFRKLLSRKQNLLFQVYKRKFYQTIGLIAVATLVAVILSVVVESGKQIVNYSYKGVLAIACLSVIYHGNQTLREIDKYDVYKQLLKLAQYQD